MAHREPCSFRGGCIQARERATRGRAVEILEYEPTIDGVLESWTQPLGPDFAGYRNHVYRVFNYARVLTKSADLNAEIIAIASAFHDLAVYTHRTFDYLEPSARMAADHVAGDERRAWTRKLELMIVMHHKLFRYRGEHEALVEGFRRADRCDLTLGTMLRSGIDRGFARELNARFPNEGFHANVARSLLRWIVTHPRQPFPYLRL